MWQQCYSMAPRRRHWKQKYQLENPNRTYTEKKGGLNLGNGDGNRHGRCCFTVVSRPFLEVYFKSITGLWTPLNNLYFVYSYLILHHGTNVADFLFSLPIAPPPHLSFKPLLGPLPRDCKPSYFIHLSIPIAYQNTWHIVGAYYIFAKLIKPYYSTLLASCASLGKLSIENSKNS